MVYYQYIHSFLYQSAWHVNINKKILNYLKQKTTHHLVFLSQTVNSYNVIMCYLHKKLAPNMNVNPGWWLALNFNSTRPWKINIHSWNVKHSITHEHNKYRYIIHIYIYIHTAIKQDQICTVHKWKFSLKGFTWARGYNNQVQHNLLI